MEGILQNNVEKFAHYIKISLSCINMHQYIKLHIKICKIIYATSHKTP